MTIGQDYKRDFKYESSKKYAGEDNSKFKVMVSHVDTNETIDDKQEEARSSWRVRNEVIPERMQLSVSGFRIDQGTVIEDIIVPQRFAGQVYMPQIGDIIVCTTNKEGRASLVEMQGTSYSDRRYAQDGDSVLPFWLSLPGDYGELRSYKDHSMQFAKKPDDHDVTYLVRNKPSFITKWVRSITGTRWRKTKYEDLEVTPNNFVLRGDNVFDINDEYMGELVVESQGYELMPPVEQYKYPEPNNTPLTLEERPEAKYRYTVHQWLKQRPDFKPDDTGGRAAIAPLKYEDKTMRTKYQFSYEPILDKKYRLKTTGKKFPKGFERELPAVEEYQVALKGNNKLLIQDITGDGSQIFVTLKTQYDEGITFIHDRDRSQVRIRDHIGNSVLLEGDRKKPRIILKTSEKQVVEMGAVEGKGEFLYMRNGPVYAGTQVPWGRTNLPEKDNVFNQELFMGDSEAILKHEEILGRVSSVLASMFVGPGIYMRTVDDSKKTYEKRFATYEYKDTLYEKSIELWKPTNTSVVTHSKVNSQGHDWFVEGKHNNTVVNFVHFDLKEITLNRSKDTSHVTLKGPDIYAYSPTTIKVLADGKLNLEGSAVTIKGNSVDIIQASPEKMPKSDRGEYKV